MGQMAEHIIYRHHGFLRRELPRLFQLLEHIRQSQGVDLEKAAEIEKIFQAVKQKIEKHLCDEEELLFPICRRLEAGEKVESPHMDMIARLQEMEVEHGNADRALTRMRELAGGLAASPEMAHPCRDLLSGLEALQADLKVHVEKENTFLHPLALELLQGLV